MWRDGVTDPYIFPENYSNIYNTYAFHGYESCTNRSMIVFYKRHVANDSLNLRLLGLAHLKYVIACNRVITTPNLRRLFSVDGATLYENVLCKPRAYFAYRSIICESDSAVASNLMRPDFDGSEALYTGKDAPLDLKTFIEGKNSIRFERSENEEVIINAQTDSKGVFILTDTYYTGWKCYVNGKETPIHRVNYCMRGIILDSGTSSIVFRFEPDIFKAGASISTISVLLCFAAMMFLKRKKTEELKS